MASQKITVIATEKKMVPVGRGYLELIPGWSGRVKQEVADYAIEKGYAVAAGDFGEEDVDTPDAVAFDDADVTIPDNSHVEETSADDDIVEPPEYEVEDDVSGSTQ